MKTGLVLGAGGVVGASWLTGALEALASETGWDPSQADCIVGTSAGSAVGCLLAEGVAPAYMGAYIAGRTLDDVAEMEARSEELAERADGARYRLHRGLPPVGPGSWRMALGTLMRPTRHPAATILAGWLPRGFISTNPIRELIDGFLAGDWPDHPSFWSVAADYGSGKRVVFGRPGAPPARAADAVAASCAIPGFYHPVSIAGRRYVDGGICSPSNADLLAGAGLDLVVCLNPMSSPAPATGGSAGDRIGALMRTAAQRRLARELTKLHEAGTRTLVIRPSPRDLHVMGWNFMARGRRVEIVETAMRTTAMALREVRDTGQLVPERSRRSRRWAPRAVPALAAAG